jgi:hypothetical protein
MISPVLFIVFNRPESTQKTFEIIRKAAPSKLYVAADGPRKDVSGDYEKCRRVRQIIENGIDWDCEVFFLFRETNLGCGAAPRNAISWFFSHEEMGIILEDDCVPCDSFFRFCTEMLTLYKDRTDIFHINGSNFQYGKKRGDYSYYFSSLVHVWGWATWRRAWKLYDLEMNDYDYVKSTHLLKKIIPWNQIEEVFTEVVNAWDLQWFFTCLKHNALTIIPNVNLIRNIGFERSDATHTTFKTPDYILKNPRAELNFPLQHPKSIKRNQKADKFTAIKVFRTIKYSWWHVLLSKLKKLISGA